MSRVTTTDFTCDLCGKRWRTESQPYHSMPDISFGDPAVAHFFASTGIGQQPDYCKECVEHVEQAITRAKEERRTLEGDTS